jgi:hypothetical protein
MNRVASHLHNQDDTQPSQKQDHIRISLEGKPALVAQLLTGMASMLDSSTLTPTSETAPLFLSRAKAAARSGYSEDRLSALVKLGKLTNHGSPGRMLFSLAEIQALQQE